MVNNCLLMRRVMDAVLRIETAFLEKRGVTLTKMRILYTIEHSGKTMVPYSQLQHLPVLRCSQPTFSRVMDALEADGLVDVERNESDNREKLASITEKGSMLCEECVQKMNEVEMQLTKGISSDEIAMFLHILERMEQNMQEHDSQ